MAGKNPDGCARDPPHNILTVAEEKVTTRAPTFHFPFLIAILHFWCLSLYYYLFESEVTLVLCYQ